MTLVEGTATVDDVDGFVERLANIGAEHGATVQAFDARYVVDREHLSRALELADRAFERGENVARDRAMEVLLYAAGRRQIDRALAMGIGEGECPAVVLVDAADPGAEQDAAEAVREMLDPGETLGAYDPERVRDFFDVSEAELRAADADLPGIVHERVALLDVGK